MIYYSVYIRILLLFLRSQYCERAPWSHGHSHVKPDFLSFAINTGPSFSPKRWGPVLISYNGIISKKQLIQLTQCSLICLFVEELQIRPASSLKPQETESLFLSTPSGSWRASGKELRVCNHTLEKLALESVSFCTWLEHVWQIPAMKQPRPPASSPGLLLLS